MAAHFSIQRPKTLLRRLRRFVGGQKAVEVLAAFLAGAHAESVTLVAFALVSGADLVGILAGSAPGAGKVDESNPLTSRFLGVGALGAGGYVLLRSTHALLAEERPAPTLLGEAVVECSIVLTIVVFWVARRRLPRAHFDPAGALRWVSVRLLLAVSVLAGLVLNGAFDLWMADPLSALPVAAFFFLSGARLLRSGREEEREERSSSPEAGALMAEVVMQVGAGCAEQARLRLIVCGGGGLAVPTARALAAKDHDVSIIEADPERCHALGGEEVGTVVCGDAADPDVLRRAGIERCDVVAALSGNAETNHRICQVAEREAVVRTVMRAPFAAEAPAGRSDSNEQEGARQLGELDGNLRILELHVAPYAPIAGRRLSDIQLPRGGRVLSTAAGESVEEERRFASGERYVVVASEKAATAMRYLFRGPSRRRRKRSA